MLRRLAIVSLCAFLLAVPHRGDAQRSVVPRAVSLVDQSVPRDRRLLSILGLTGTYVALGTWMWFAWYADQPSLSRVRYGGDGWFGATTYAGGADKLGHVWANLALSRLGTEVLRSGGWEGGAASLIASALSFSAFALVEVNDGFYTELSPGDLTANTLGAALAVAMSNWAELDDAIDFRAQWLPSRAFLRHPGPNFAEDYSGQTYLLAYKPRSISAIRTGHASLSWLQFLNPVLAFESRNYKPAPRAGDATQRRQNLFLGLTLDLQAAVDASQSGTRGPGARRRHRVAHAFFEVFNLPLSTAPLLSLSRTPD